VNTDRLINFDAGKALASVFELIEHLQDLSVEDQVIVPALFLRLVSDVTGVDLPRLFGAVANATADERSSHYEHFEAARAYISGELNGQ